MTYVNFNLFITTDSLIQYPYICIMSILSLLDGAGLLHQIIQADQHLMLWINRDLSNPVADAITPFLRESIFHVPVYVFLFLFVLINLGKKGWGWILGAVLLIAMADGLSSTVIKPFFGRLRPCNDPDMMSQIRFLAKYCGANASFTSSHATNHFAIASFVYSTLKSFSKYFSFFFVWASLISISQVYVGVHYPLDIVGGALLGLFLGWLVARISRQVLSLQ